MEEIINSQTLEHSTLHIVNRIYSKDKKNYRENLNLVFISSDIGVILELYSVMQFEQRDEYVDVGNQDSQ